ncbi:interferon-inducible GTPase 5-like [Sphaerodactylus townsendi]|uniref:interferon-inducible GTPase 5-like n=1 Tax=Sphaerodactylus townsendi TaxID=933632 RepID=UPI0020271D48|nr:interferon-inducible GTPase 5-like [Sphaerodactylus townsendi]
MHNLGQADSVHSVHSGVQKWRKPTPARSSGLLRPLVASGLPAAARRSRFHFRFRPSRVFPVETDKSALGPKVGGKRQELGSGEAAAEDPGERQTLGAERPGTAVLRTAGAVRTQRDFHYSHLLYLILSTTTLQEHPDLWLWKNFSSLFIRETSVKMLRLTGWCRSEGSWLQVLLADYCHLKIAVVGEPGSGKSSFVNSMIGKRAGEPGAAETGIQTTTVKAKDYHHPTSLHRSSLWDLLWEEGRLSFHSPRIEQVDPETRLLTLLQSLLGCTSGFSGPGPLRPGPRDPSDIRVRTSYFSADQNRQSHSWKIAPQRRLSRLIKGFCDEKKVLQRIKDDCVTSLLNENVRDPQVFLVSNWDPQSYDFPLLWEKLQSDLLWLKREAFIFSLPSLAAPVLGRKMESVKKKISLIVLYSSLLALLPVPGFSFVAAMFFFVRFRSLCYREFGLDDPSLKALAGNIGKPVASLHAVMKSRSLMPLILWRVPDLVGAVLMLVEYCRWDRYPYAGSLVSGGVSVFTSYYMLQRCIVAVAKDAQNVLSKVLEKTSV